VAFLMYHQNICLKAQKRTKKSVNNSVSLTELIRIFTDYKPFATVLSHVLCCVALNLVTALKTRLTPRISTCKPLYFLSQTLYILIKCDLLTVYADKFNISGGSTHTIKKNTEA
jgi:hypothetical protein